jgi:hypothetical protein
MTARTAQLALLVDQFMSAAEAIAPMFAGIIAGFSRAGGIILRFIIFGIWRIIHTVITACLPVGGEYNPA